MIPLSDKETKSYEKVCYIYKKEFSTDENDKNAFTLYHKVRDHCHYTWKFRGAAHSIHNLRYNLNGQFECLGENTEKYITFSVPFKKELDHGKTITYKLKFIHSFRFMNTLVSDLFDNLSDIYKNKCKICKERRKIKSACDFFGLKNNKLKYECKECEERWLKPINGLTKKFPNIYQFCNGYIHEFVLLLRKCVYPYEYMDSWEKFNETSYQIKNPFLAN